MTQQQQYAMMLSRQEYELFLSLIGSFITIAIVIFVLVFACLALKKMLSALFMMGLAQDQRDHFLRVDREKFARRVALLCLVLGVSLPLSGMDMGNFHIILPGGFELDNASIGAFLLLIVCFVIFHMLSLSRSGTKKTAATASRGEAALPLGEKPVAPTLMSIGDAPLPMQTGIASAYIKAGIITLILLPFVGPFALLAGGWILWAARKGKKGG